MSLGRGGDHRAAREHATPRAKWGVTLEVTHPIAPEYFLYL